ncbi:MAG: hypothetical protein MPF33_00680 [Candidatus Aramenus sp.]|jgi:putative Ca2+/H+ antiporter (TMEM165/GDT1 family)|nr:hypothetical protein [Candidatus Aramenus sp.]
MKQWQTTSIAILLVLLPAIPAFVRSFYGFVGGSVVGFVIALYLFLQYKPWESLNNAVVSTFFTGIFAFGLGLAVFLDLPMKPKDYALVTLAFSIPFVVSLAFLLRPLIGNLLRVDLIKFGNGYVAMLIVVIIGAIIGRFFHNFYELIVLYSGFITLGIIAYLYFKE